MRFFREMTLLYVQTKSFFKGIIVCMKSVIYSILFTQTHMMFGKHNLSQT